MNNYSASENGLALCHNCHQVTPVEQERCPRCNSKLNLPNKNSLQITWALIITACIFYIPANTYPIMITDYFGQQSVNTILGGVFLLWDDGSYTIAMIIFLASVVVPIIKLISLIWLCLNVHFSINTNMKNRITVYRWIHFIGRWSMIDVFVVAILVALIQFGNIMEITPGIAAFTFALVVILTMLATTSFDSRLLWCNLTEN